MTEAAFLMRPRVSSSGAIAINSDLRRHSAEDLEDRPPLDGDEPRHPVGIAPRLGPDVNDGRPLARRQLLSEVTLGRHPERAAHDLMCRRVVEPLLDLIQTQQRPGQHLGKRPSQRRLPRSGNAGHHDHVVIVHVVIVPRIRSRADRRPSSVPPRRQHCAAR
jgi:hypothetical protein